MNVRVATSAALWKGVGSRVGVELGATTAAEALDTEAEADDGLAVATKAFVFPVFCALAPKISLMRLCPVADAPRPWAQSWHLRSPFFFFVC